MKIGYLQFEPELGKSKRNSEKVESFISKDSFDLLVIPELANSGYLFEDPEELSKVSENPDTGKYCGMLKRMSREKNAYIVSGFCESAMEEGGKVYYNSSILVYPDGEFRIYRKTHLFFDEKKFFKPGNTGYWVYDIYNKKFGTVKLGMMLCFDWIFPEAARTLALRGADIICHPSNLVMSYCQSAMFTRALENRVFTVTANRTGTDVNGENSIEFTGESIIVSPRGEYISRASKDKEELGFVNVDPELSRNKYINEKNNLFDDRRELFYFRKH
jgi:predicted amidohydrolase